MNVAVDPHALAQRRDLPFQTVALVLQGGGALGAYQAGRGRHPSRLVGGRLALGCRLRAVQRRSRAQPAQSAQRRDGHGARRERVLQHADILAMASPGRSDRGDQRLRHRRAQGHARASRRFRSPQCRRDPLALLFRPSPNGTCRRVSHQTLPVHGALVSVGGARGWRSRCPNVRPIPSCDGIARGSAQFFMTSDERRRRAGCGSGRSL